VSVILDLAQSKIFLSLGNWYIKLSCATDQILGSANLSAMSVEPFPISTPDSAHSLLNAVPLSVSLWNGSLGEAYGVAPIFGYVNRSVVVIGDAIKNELNRQFVGIEKSLGVEWSGFRFIFFVTLCERQHVEAFCNIETSKTRTALLLHAWTGP
jgi:hypothetical protein